MGMFDTVMVDCPKCGAPVEAQSKGGECDLRTYTLETAPADVLSDVNRHAPHKCEACSTRFRVDISDRARAEIAKWTLLIREAEL